jgi:hypothetical protein
MVASRDHIVVDVTSIDAFVSEGHAPPDAIIMDVQGAEFDVLNGASELFASKHSVILFTEFWHSGLDERHPNGAAEMLSLLDRAGFQISLIDEKGHTIDKISSDELLQRFSGNLEANLLCTR